MNYNDEYFENILGDIMLIKHEDICMISSLKKTEVLNSYIIFNCLIDKQNKSISKNKIEWIISFGKTYYIEFENQDFRDTGKFTVEKINLDNGTVFIEGVIDSYTIYFSEIKLCVEIIQSVNNLSKVKI